MRPYHWITACIIATSALIGAGCESTEDIMPIRVDPTPLAVDPLDDIPVDGWWRSDDRLLHLQPRGSYTAYQGDSRYGLVAERGRWGRLSYAHITLEPYRVLNADAQRWTLRRIDGRLTLERGDEAFKRLAAEPKAEEDDLLGTWSSRQQSLQLGADMRCIWRRADGARDVHGHWMLQGNAIIIETGIANDAPIQVAVIRDDDGNVTSLVTPNGEMTTHKSP